MKITVERDNDKLTIELPFDSSGDELLRQFEAIMFWLTYHPNTIESVILNRAEEIRNTIKE